MEGEVLVMIPQTVRLGVDLNYHKAGKQTWHFKGTNFLYNFV
jgi:hypothetical protein